MRHPRRSNPFHPTPPLETEDVATIRGTEGNDFRTITNPQSFTFDGLGGVDTMSFGTSSESDYTITKTADGAVHVDTISGASSPAHVTLFNVEIITFSSDRDVIDLRTYFGDTTPPTVTISDDTPGTARGNVTYALDFSENVAGLAAGDLVITNGTLVSLFGSGANYKVVVAPAANVEGTMALTLKAGAVSDSSGNPNAQAGAAAQPIDTKAPTATAFSPANQAAGVAVGSDIVVSFSEAIQRGNGSITLKDGSGAVLASYDAATSANLSLSGAQLTINPTNDLPAGTSVTVELAAGSVRDLAGNGLGAAVGLNFSTGGSVAKVLGTPGNDSFTLGEGTAPYDGLAGIDTAVLPLPRASYTVTRSPAGFVVSSTDGRSSHELVNVERLQFADGKLALDVSGNAGEVAKILGAVFGPAQVGNATYTGIGLNLADGGMSYEALMQLALDAQLGPGASNTAVVQLLYTNVVGVAPPPADLASFTALLDNHTYTPATLGILAAETDLNLAHIGLVGLLQTGVVYA